MTGKKCQAKRRDGQPCQAWARADALNCIAHDTASKSIMRAARQRGGATHAAATRRRPRRAVLTYVGAAYEVLADDGLAYAADDGLLYVSADAVPGGSPADVPAFVMDDEALQALGVYAFVSWDEVCNEPK